LEPIIGDIVFEDGKYFYITEENISRYTIQDVLMPLPGYNVKYPKYDFVHAPVICLIS
jgi:hypothetical protein